MDLKKGLGEQSLLTFTEPHWNENKHIILEAMQKLRAITGYNDATHMIIGSSLNSFKFYNLLRAIVNENIYFLHNQVTFLNGKIKCYATKEQVKQLYSSKWLIDRNHLATLFSSSVNDDLERMMQQMIVGFSQDYYDVEQRMFLCEMLEEAEIEEETSKEMQFTVSECLRATWTLYRW